MTRRAPTNISDLRAIGIQAIAYRLGSVRETSAQLQADRPEWDLAAIESKTGITARYLAARGETASDMAERAARDLFERGVDPRLIDALIFVTQSPDYVLPTTACLLQDRLGIPTSAIAFDINQGCSGFVYGLSVGTALIHAGLASRVLLLCGDTYSRYIRPDDRACRPIFSDGAAAALIGGDELAGVGPFIFGSDGSGGPDLIVHGRGGRDDADGHDPQPARLAMNGPKVLMFTMAAVPDAVRRLLETGGLTKDDVDLFVFHQASALVLDTIARHLEIPASKLYSNVASIGNTVSATIPIALVDAAREGRLRPGDTVLICGFGVGYSWAAGLLRWGAGAIWISPASRS